MAVMLGTASAQVTLDISQFMGAAKQAEGAMNQLAGAGSAGTGPTILDRFTKGALGLGTALIAPMTLGLKAAVDLEQGIANVNAALGGVDGSTLDMLADQFNTIGINSQYSAVQVAAVAEELAKAGFAAPELAGVTQSVVDLAQATGTDLPTSVGAVSQAMAVWQEGIVDSTIALTDASRVADIYTVAANNSSASVQDIAIGMRSLGPVAASMGISFEQAAAGVALFTNYGLTGADAGISLARGIQNLSDPTTEAAAAMEALGIQAFDTQGQFIGLGPLFEQLNTSMAGMTDQQKLATLSLIFGAEAMDVMGLAVLTGSDAYNELTGEMEESGAAAEASAIRMDTLAAQFGTLKEGVNTFLGSLVSGLIPGLRIIVDALNGFIDVLSNIPGPIKTVIGAVAGLLASFAAVTRSIQTFRALNGIMATFAGNSGAAAVASRGLMAGLLRFVPALALVSAGFLIWKTNIFGVQDRLKDFVNGLRKFGRSFSESFRNLTADIKSFNIWGGENGVLAQGMATLPALFIAFGNALADVGGGIPILEDIGVAAIGFGDTIVHLTEAFTHFRDLGLDPIQAGLRAIGIMFPSLSGLAGSLQIVVGQVTEAFRSLSAGDFGEAFDSIVAAVQSAISSLGQLGSIALDVVVSIGSFLWETAVDIGADLVGWIKDNALSTAQDIGNIAVSVGSIIWSAATDIFSGLALWLRGNISGIAQDIGNVAVNVGGIIWGATADIFSGFVLWAKGMLSAAQDIGTVAVTVGAIAWSATADIFGGFVTWVSQSIALEDFGIVGETLGEKIRSALGLAFSGGRSVGGAGGAVLTGAASIAQWLADQINGMDFASVGEAVGRKLAQAIALVFAGGVGFESLKASFLAGVSAAINDMDWATIGTSFWNLFTAVMNAPQEFMQGVLTGVGTAIGDAVEQIDWDTIASSIGTELSGAIEGASDFAAGIGNKLNAELQQALNSVDFSGLAGLIGGKLSAAIEGVEGFATNLGGKLQNELIQAFNGIDWTGLGGTVANKLGEGIANTVGFASSIGGKLLDEFTQAISGIDFSSIGSSIKDKLVDSVQGVGQAIWDAILAELTGASGGEDITPKVPPGGDIDPFFTTIVDGFARVTDAANEARAAIGGVFGGGVGAGGRGAVGGGAGPDAFLGSLTTVQTALLTLTTTAQNTALAMSIAGQLAGQAFATGLSAGLNTAVAAVANSLSTIVSVTSSLMAAMAAAAAVGMASVRASVQSGMNAVIVAIANGMATARAVTAAGAASMAASMVAGMATFRAAVTSGMAAAVGAVRSGVAQMVAAAAAGRGAMAAAGLSMGAALGQGVAAGIQSQIGAVAAAAAALVSAAVGAARSAGQISSPSKVMRDEIGMNLALGVAQGIYDGLPAIYRAGASMIPQVPVGQYANSAPYGGMAVTHTTIVHAPVTIEGNVTTEQAIIENATEYITTTIAQRAEQRATALGVRR